MVINVKIQNRVAEYLPSEEKPVCGNDSDVIRFSFDGEWSKYTERTVRFIWGGNKFFEQEFKGDTCPVPAFVNTDRVLVGVLAGDEGDRIATTRTEIPYLPSIRCGGARPDTMTAEAYQNLAKEAAETAKSHAEAAASHAQNAKNEVQEQVEACRAAADEAARSLTQAKLNVSLTSDFSERAEAVAYDLENRKFEDRLREQSYRISQMTKDLGLSDTLQVIRGNIAAVDIPANAVPFVKIERLECANIENFWCDGWFPQGVSAIKLLDADGALQRSYTIPVSTLPDYGEGDAMSVDSPLYSLDNRNYVSFANGKAYYHHNVYSVTLSDYGADPVKRHKDDRVVTTTAYQAILGLHEPEVIDITDLLGFGGFVELEGISRIAFEQMLAEDGDEVNNGLVGTWFASPVRVLIDTH